jgi:tetratricopeptide (TPR) repeat protein
MLATKALAQAEKLSSLDARGVVYWNAAYVAQAKGDIGEALRLTERALALFGELENRWATATLRRNAGWLMLQLPEVDAAQAQPVLERALADLHECGRPGDIAETESELARCCLLTGDLESASRFATAALERASNGTVLEHAKALLVQADVTLAQGDAERAVIAYRTAALELDSAHAVRHAAAAWRQLGSLLMDLGRYAAAKDAYERLADATGVPKSPSGSRLIRSC